MSGWSGSAPTAGTGSALGLHAGAIGISLRLRQRKGWVATANESTFRGRPLGISVCRWFKDNTSVTPFKLPGGGLLYELGLRMSSVRQVKFSSPGQRQRTRNLCTCSSEKGLGKSGAISLFGTSSETGRAGSRRQNAGKSASLPISRQVRLYSAC